MSTTRRNVEVSNPGVIVSPIRGYPAKMTNWKVGTEYQQESKDDAKGRKNTERTDQSLKINITGEWCLKY